MKPNYLPLTTIESMVRSQLETKKTQSYVTSLRQNHDNSDYCIRKMRKPPALANQLLKKSITNSLKRKLNANCMLRSNTGLYSLSPILEKCRPAFTKPNNSGHITAAYTHANCSP